MTLLQMGFFANNDDNLDVMFSTLFDSVLKIAFVIVGLLYLVFAFIAVRQISIMRKTLVTPFSPVIAWLGYIHFILALIIFLIFILL